MTAQAVRTPATILGSKLELSPFFSPFAVAILDAEAMSNKRASC